MARADGLRLAPRPPALPRALPRAMWVAALLALAGHAALLLAPWDDGRADGVTAPVNRPAARVRMLEGPDRPEPQPGVAVRGSAPSPAPSPAQTTGPSTPPSTAQPQTALTVAVDPSPADAPASAAARALTTAADEEALFLVRSQLDRAPYASEPIDLPYPESAPLGHHQAVMTLFIDEQGRVRRVRLDIGQMLPPLLEDAARQTFLRSRFEPGIKDGAPVRSRLRVAVEFGAEAPR